MSVCGWLVKSLSRGVLLVWREYVTLYIGLFGKMVWVGCLDEDDAVEAVFDVGGKWWVGFERRRVDVRRLD